MPIDVDLNGVEKRLYPTESLQSLDISKHAVVYLRDWEFYIINLENPDIKTNDKESSL
jgi:hypothetical protein